MCAMCFAASENDLVLLTYVSLSSYLMKLGISLFTHEHQASINVQLSWYHSAICRTFAVEVSNTRSSAF